MESLGEAEDKPSSVVQLSMKNDNNSLVSLDKDNDLPLSVSETSVKVGDNSLSVDEMLTVVGEYGRFQKIVNLMFCVIMFPSGIPVIIAYFIVKNPSWRCAPNSTFCHTKNHMFSNTNSSRCAMPRTDWEYVTSRSYSIVTEFDLICGKEYLVELQTSVFFFGFIFGAGVIGWVADNFGRKRVHFLSLTFVILLGFASVFVGNIYAFIVCRFLIGFFSHGTFPQLFIMISEIVGDKHRAFANNIIYFSVGFVFSSLALKAYLIQNWQVLYVVCTVPYLSVLLFAKFVPESVRYLRVKGELEEAMRVFRRIAYWNKVELPSYITIPPTSHGRVGRKSSPLDLFRTFKIASATFIFGWASFTAAMGFYCMYYAAGDISGHMYGDFVLITALDLPASLICTPLFNKYGRKRSAMALLLGASIACLGLGFTPNHGKIKILRVLLGMFGKSLILMSGMAQSVWALETYPTYIRGEATGFLQILNKIGATSSPWIDKHLSKFYRGGVFILIGALSFVTVVLLSCIPETYGVTTADTDDFAANNISSKNVDYIQEGEGVSEYKLHAIAPRNIDLSNGERDASRNKVTRLDNLAFTIE